jgi:beta-glucosidase
MSINWIDKNIDGIIYAGYPGAKGGTAIADVLFGDYNPGGKLTVTFPKSVGQLPYNFPSKPYAQSDAGESAKIRGLLYPFGFGLSYTSFRYNNLRISPSEQQQGQKIDVWADITNSGETAGDEVVQLYIRDILASVTTYEKSLRGFERISLEPGETKTVHFILEPDDLKLWNRQMQHVVEPGAFKVMVGSSSENIKLTGSFLVKE